MGQVFDLAGHGSFEYEQRGFETAVGGILKNKIKCLAQWGKQGNRETEARVVLTICQMYGLLR